MNNRQAGRRRGRGGGGQRQGGGNPNRPDNGNRIDNRARGNANQLYEKYKTLARDAQMQGDRVNTEYYLQFADHYFRVLSENRSRFEEQNPNQAQRRPQGPDAFGDEDFDDYEADGNVDAPIVEERRVERQGGNGAHRNGQGGDQGNGREGNGRDRGESAGNGRRERAERPERAERQERVERPQPVEAVEQDGGEAAVEAPAPRRRGRPRREAPVEAVSNEAPEGLDIDRLPPALGIAPAAEGDNDTAEEAPRPRRRRGRPANDEVTPPAA
jgi:hypothetical protein